jgi:hypothetical protein
MPPKTKDPITTSDPIINDQITHINQTLQDHSNLVTSFESRLNDLTTHLETMTTTQSTILQSNQELAHHFPTFQDTITNEILTTNQCIDNKFDSILQILNQQAPSSSSSTNPTPSAPSSQPHATTHRFQATYDNMQQQQTPSLVQSSPQTTSFSGSQKPTGFHQKESRDFHVSKFRKLLADDSLNSDSLQDLELFYDGIISHLNTVALTSDLFPSYQDLTTTFDFKDHLHDTFQSVHLSPLEYTQGLINYETFGKGLRKFLLDPKTIPSTTCHLVKIKCTNHLDLYPTLHSSISSIDFECGGLLGPTYPVRHALHYSPLADCHFFFDSSLFIFCLACCCCESLLDLEINTKSSLL